MDELSVETIGFLLCVGMIFIGGGFVTLLFRGVGMAASQEQRYLEDVARPSVADRQPDGGVGYAGLADELAWERRGDKCQDGLPRTMGRKACQEISQDYRLQLRQQETDALLERELRNYRMRHDDNSVDVGDL
jgi:hypothetical protein